MQQPQEVAMGAAQPGMTTAVVMPNNDKSVLVSYLLWFFLGILGVHHLYMGRGVGVFILALISFQGLGLWWLIDLFMIPGSTNMQRGGQMVIVA
jgi:TM2 domain-containing membrane protein YozV